MLGQDIGIDLGTASILVYLKGRGIIAKEPSVVAIDKDTNRLLAVGTEAQQMLGRTPDNIEAMRPLKDGTINEYEVTEKMLQYFIRRASSKTLFLPRVMITVPTGISDVERRAILDASREAGSKKTFLIEAPIAAALGAGLDINTAIVNLFEIEFHNLFLRLF